MFLVLYVFFFNDTATTEIYTLSLHDALPICLRHESGRQLGRVDAGDAAARRRAASRRRRRGVRPRHARLDRFQPDRKSTRLNSSHANISYAVFCLKKKKTIKQVISDGT